MVRILLIEKGAEKKYVWEKPHLRPGAKRKCLLSAGIKWKVKEVWLLMVSGRIGLNFSSKINSQTLYCGSV